MTINDSQHTEIKRLTRFSMAAVQFTSHVECLVRGHKMQRIPKIDGNFMLLANHSFTHDALPIAGAIPGYTRVVIGDAMLYRGISDSFATFIEPIIFPQAAPSLNAIRRIIKFARNGESIAMYPEGYTTIDGVTRQITSSTGSLVKKCGCALVTYRVEGGYLTHPMWARFRRKGRVRGYVAGVYTAEQLAEMSADEINEIIRRDLHYDAYAAQEQLMEKHPGPRKAEGLENLFAICPCCGSYNTIRTRDDKFWCSKDGCELKGEIDNYGFLHSEQMPHTTIPQLERWMIGRFDVDCAAKSTADEPLFVERGISLFEMRAGYEMRDTGDKGELHVFANRMELRNGKDELLRTFGFDEVRQSMILMGCSQLLFSTKEGRFLFDGEHFPAWKTQRLIETAHGTQQTDRL